MLLAVVVGLSPEQDSRNSLSLAGQAWYAGAATVQLSDLGTSHEGHTPDEGHAGVGVELFDALALLRVVRHVVHSQLQQHAGEGSTCRSLGGAQHQTYDASPRHHPLALMARHGHRVASQITATIGCSN